MSVNYEQANTPVEYAHEILERSQLALTAAVAIVSPERPARDPLEVFPAPNERRADDPGLELNSDQEVALRSVASELGWGRETDRTLAEEGLFGAYAILEGGQPHKMIAEAQLVIDGIDPEDPKTKPTAIIFSAAAGRIIKNQGEADIALRLLGRVGNTEYEVARDVIKSLPSFEPYETEQDLPFSYDINNDFEVSPVAKGQFRVLGTVDSIPVVLMRIDRENYKDPATGADKYRNQPSTSDVVNIIDAISMANGDQLLPIAFVTSSTYEPSRSVDAVKSWLLTERMVKVASYGSNRLASVKGETIAPGQINQLPGELHKVAKNVAALKQILEV